MRIALLSHFYPPEPCAAAIRISALVKALRERGHDVTIVTNFPSFPQGKLAPQDRRRFFERSCEEDTIVRLFSVVYKGPASRLVHWCSAALASTAFLLFSSERFDVIIVTVPPITLALPALLGAARHRAVLITDVRDVYPDVAIAMGKWRAGGALARIARAVTGVLYARSSLIATVSPRAIRQIAARRVDASRLFYAPNGCDPQAPVRNGVKQHGARFVGLYVGNLGLATDIDVLVDAAIRLKDDEAIRIRIAGDGAEGERLRRRIAAERLHNIEYEGAVSRERALQMTASADVALVPLRRGIADSIPSKLFDALSAGCPAIVAAEGDVTSIALESRGALCVPPGDAQALADAIRRVRAMNERERKHMGDSGRAYVRRFHRRDTIMGAYADRIAALSAREACCAAERPSQGRTRTTSR